jgi:hypothetical protein
MALQGYFDSSDWVTPGEIDQQVHVCIRVEPRFLLEFVDVEVSLSYQLRHEVVEDGALCKAGAVCCNSLEHEGLHIRMAYVRASRCVETS